MSGPKRNPDKLNTIGVVVVGICGAVLVYVTIVGLQAFYVSDTSEIQTMMDYGGQDLTAKGHKADEMRNITEAGKNAVGPGQESTFRIPIEHAMKLVAEQAKTDPSHLIPSLPPSTKASIEPVFGRPKPAAAPAPTAPAPGTPEAGSAAGSAVVPTNAAPTSPTGQPGAPQPVPGAGGVPAGAPQGNTGGGATNPAGTTPATGAPGPQPPKTDATKTPAPKAPAPKAPAPKAPAPKAPAPAATQPKAAAPAPAPAPAQPKNP